MALESLDFLMFVLNSQLKPKCLIAHAAISLASIAFGLTGLWILKYMPWARTSRRDARGVDRGQG